EALLFDFNGTVSDDEELLFRIYAAMFERFGLRLVRADYMAHLAGRSDEEIFTLRLGRDVDVAALIRERVERYIDAAGDGSTVAGEVRTALVVAATRVRVGIVTSSWRSEVEAVLRGAGLAGL